MDSQQEQATSGGLVLTSLVIAGFATKPARIVITLLLIEVAQTFGSAVGAMGQIQTVSSIMEILSALLMGALSVRFRHKTLLMIGLGFLGLSALGCFGALSFNTMLIAYALTGLGTAMALPMATTLVGEHLALEKRSIAIGMISAGMSIAYVVSPTLINQISRLGSWRYAFLIYVLPVPSIGLLLAARSLPTRLPSSDPKGAGRLAEGFRKITTNRSALPVSAVPSWRWRHGRESCSMAFPSFARDSLSHLQEVRPFFQAWPWSLPWAPCGAGGW